MAQTNKHNKEKRNKELSLSLGIAAHLNTLDDIMFDRGWDAKNIHECMRMWQKLHNRYFYGNDTGYKSKPPKNEQSMSVEDKDLVLRDLCARLPYNVWVSYKTKYDDIERATILNGNYVRDIMEGTSSWIDFKPYLRPMSSMTEEEKEEFKNKFKGFFQYFNGSIISDSRIYDKLEAVFVGEEICGELIDWLNMKKFDWRRLIPKDLALSTDKFNPYKN